MKDTQKPARRTAATKTTSAGFTAEERAAVKDYVREKAVVWGKNKAEDDRLVLAKIAQMPESDRSMGKRIHDIIGTVAPSLSPRLWYGMPAYTKEGDVVCFFQAADKFKARYATLGFSDKAHLEDEGHMWPTAFALTKLTVTDEARIATLVKKAVS